MRAEKQQLGFHTINRGHSRVGKRPGAAVSHTQTFPQVSSLSRLPGMLF